MENNSNDVNLDCGADFAIASDEAKQRVSKDVMEMCNAMPLYPQYPTIEIDFTTVSQNDENTELAEEDEVLTFLDLDLHNSLGSNQTEMVWDDEEKCNLLPQQAPEPVDVLNVEMMGMEFESLPTPLSDTKSSLGISLSQELSADSYWIPSLEPISNNFNPTRSRKMSYKNEKSVTKVIKPASKVAFQKKLFRPRATKSDMESMTETEKMQRKKIQNKMNAKKCVQKKNDEKAGLAVRIEELTKQEEEVDMIYEGKSTHVHELYRDSIWPKINNNSAYGNPDEFSELLIAKMNAVSASIYQNTAPELKKLEKDFELAQKNYDEIIYKGKNGIPANTFASKKSRANTSLTIAMHRYKAGRLQTAVDQKLAMIKALDEFNHKLNPCRRFLGYESLNELVVMKNNEPS
uniref:BZIP domain-containing protein n=1 Tax=Caenorhabditis japonica TaxID=281687 RepID=A0A8R1I1E8_CAEJA